MEETEERKRALKLRKKLAGTIRKLWAEGLSKDNLKLIYFLLGKVQETLDGRLDTLSIDGPAVCFETEDELKKALAVLDSDKDFDVDRAATGLSAVVSHKLGEMYREEVRSAKTLPKTEVRRIQLAARRAQDWLADKERDSMTCAELATQSLAAALDPLSVDYEKPLVGAALRFQLFMSKRVLSDAEIDALEGLHASLAELELAAASAGVPVKTTKTAGYRITEREQKMLKEKAEAVVKALDNLCNFA